MPLTQRCTQICYSVDDLLPICRECEIPLVFVRPLHPDVRRHLTSRTDSSNLLALDDLVAQDYHHDWINPSKLPTPLIMPEILATWNVRGGVRVKQHLSEPRKGAVTIMEKRGHADRSVLSLPLRIARFAIFSDHRDVRRPADARASL